MNNQSVPEHLIKIEKELKELKKYLKKIPKEEENRLVQHLDADRIRV